MYPSRVNCILKSNPSTIALDQIRTINKKRLGDYIDTFQPSEIKKVKNVIEEMLVK